MTVWVRHQALSAQEEAQIEQRTHLTLPFETLPDLSMVNTQAELRQLLQTLHAGEPPEAIALKQDRIWAIFGELQIGDLIVVPLAHSPEIALAEMSGRYCYRNNGTEDIHFIPVTWHKRFPARKLGKHKDLILRVPTHIMAPVENRMARTAVRNTLPHSYNRFVKWKWLLGLFFLMGIARVAHHLMN